MTFNRDTYQTPKFVFNYLNTRFQFNIDGCASSKNALCDKFITAEIDFNSENAFKVIPEKSRIFINPPYSNVTPFLQTAKRLRDQKNCTVVFLLNNDKSTHWYRNCVQNVANEVIEIVGKRIDFIHPATQEVAKGNSKGQMFVIFDATADDYVIRSVDFSTIERVGKYGN